MVRTFQLTKALSRMTVMDNMMLGAQNQAGENLAKSLFRPFWGAQEKEIEAKALGAAGAVQTAGEAHRLRRVALRRPAQAARDGPGPDERPEDDHARRADGGREPRAHPVSPGAHPEPARRGHDGAVRRARHARRPPHLRLGRRDGRGPHRRRGRGRHGDVQPSRHRRLPRRPPRHRPGGRRTPLRRDSRAAREGSRRGGGRARGGAAHDAPTPSSRPRSSRPRTSSPATCPASTSSTAAAWSPTPAR